MTTILVSSAIIMMLVAANAGLYRAWQKERENSAEKDRTIDQLKWTVELQNGMLKSDESKSCRGEYMEVV